MAAKKRAASPEPGSSRADPAVVALLRELDHPLKREIEIVRQIILGASPEIREGIKWNAPSFRTTEYFATFNLRAKDRIRLILHRGAKVKDATKRLPIADPAGQIPLVRSHLRDPDLRSLDRSSKRPPSTSDQPA